MPVYSVVSNAAWLSTLIEADSTRDALQSYEQFIAAWKTDDSKRRNVEGLIVTPSPLAECRIEVANADDQNDRLTIEPHEDERSDLQAALSAFIEEAETPGSQTPPELLSLAIELYVPLRIRLIGDGSMSNPRVAADPQHAPFIFNELCRLRRFGEKWQPLIDEALKKVIEAQEQTLATLDKPEDEAQP